METARPTLSAVVACLESAFRSLEAFWPTFKFLLPNLPLDSRSPARPEARPGELNAAANTASRQIPQGRHGGSAPCLPCGRSSSSIDGNDRERGTLRAPLRSRAVHRDRRARAWKVSPRRRGKRRIRSASPPGDRTRLAQIKISQRGRDLLLGQQRDQGRAVPEFHRPSRRSARRASKALAPLAGRGGFDSRISRGRGAEARRSSPWRSSRARRPSGSSPSPSTDSSRATGRPRSRMRIVSPCWTWSTRALRLFLVSVKVALFI